MYKKLQRNSEESLIQMSKQTQPHTSLLEHTQYPRQFFKIYSPDSFKCIKFSKEKENPSDCHRNSSEHSSPKIIQCMKTEIACKKDAITPANNNNMISSLELWNILNDATSISDFSLNPKKAADTTDWFDTFKNIHNKMNNSIADQKTKITLDGTEFLRHDHWNNSEHKKLNYIYYPGDMLGSYPELAEKMKTSTEDGQKQGKEIRRLIHSGIKAETGIANSTHARDTDITLKQSTLALFGAETARSPRAFLSNMMLLDNMQSGDAYGTQHTKKLTLSNLLQRDSKGRSFKVKSTASFTDTNNSPMTTKDKTGHSTSNIRAMVGGKASMAGANTLKLAQENVFRKENIVHAKEVSIFINWLLAQNGSFENMTKNEAIVTIKSLLAKRAQTYEFMAGGQRESEFNTTLEESKKTIDTLESSRERAKSILKRLTNKLHKNNKKLSKSNQNVMRMNNKISKEESNLKKYLASRVIREFSAQFSENLLQTGVPNSINNIEYLSDFITSVSRMSTLKFTTNEYLKVYSKSNKKDDKNIFDYSTSFIVEKNTFLSSLDELYKNGKTYDPLIALKDAKSPTWQGPYEDEIEAKQNDLKNETHTIIYGELKNIVLDIYEQTELFTYECPNSRMAQWINQNIIPDYIQKRQQNVRKINSPLSNQINTLETQRIPSLNSNKVELEKQIDRQKKEIKQIEIELERMKYKKEKIEKGLHSI